MFRLWTSVEDQHRQQSGVRPVSPEHPAERDLCLQTAPDQHSQLSGSESTNGHKVTQLSLLKSRKEHLPGWSCFHGIKYVIIISWDFVFSLTFTLFPKVPSRALLEKVISSEYVHTFAPFISPSLNLSNFIEIINKESHKKGWLLSSEDHGSI